MKLRGKILDQFLKLMGEKLSGEWIIIGGTVLPMLGINHRITVDIDVASKNKKEETLKLMAIADELGLSVETINQSGAYFLYQIESFEKNLLPLYKGSRSEIYRPNLWLFFELKIKRLSESDALDCLEYIKYSKKHNEVSEQDIEKIKKSINQKIQKESNKEKIKRLKSLVVGLVNN